MKQLLSLLATLLLCIDSGAQTTQTYHELRAKMLHIKESFFGQSNTANRASTMVLQRLCNDYQGHLTLHQYKELAADVASMRQQTGDTNVQYQLDEVCRLLRQKSDTLDIEKRILEYYAHVPQEQIYLHTDKTYYVPGDTIWFRAHLGCSLLR